MLKINYLTVLFIFISIDISFSSDITKSIDLMPIDMQRSVIEVNKSDTLNKRKPVTKYNINNIGLYNKSKYPISFNLKNYEHEIITSNFPLGKKNDILATKIKFHNINLPLIFNSWDKYIAFSYFNKINEEITCYENNDYVISVINKTCKANGKLFYKTQDNSVANLSGNSLGLGLGVRKEIVEWKTKSIIELLIQNEITDYKLRFDNFFESLQDYENNFPNGIHSDLSLSASYRSSKIFYKKYSFGYAVSAKHKKHFNKNLNDKSNLFIDLRLSRLISDRYFISFGNSWSLKFDEESPFYHKIDTQEEGKNYHNKLMLSFGIIGKNLNLNSLEKFNKDEVTSLFTIKNKNSLNSNLNPKNEYIKTDELNDESDKYNINSNTNLRDYAIKFAKKSDKI